MSEIYLKRKCNKKEGFFNRLKKDLVKNKTLYFIVLLPLLYYIIFHYVPMYGLIISFKNYSPMLGISGSKWVGFKHFIDFFDSIYFWRLIGNTFRLSFYSLLFGFPAPIILALLINEFSNKYFVKTVQTITYLPYFISLVVIWIIMSVVRQILEPKIVSGKIGIHPIFTLIAMYTGYRVSGLIGLLVGPIVLIILKSIFSP